MNRFLVVCSTVIVCTLVGGVLGLIVGEETVSHRYPELRGFSILAYTVYGAAIGVGVGILIGFFLARLVKRGRAAG